MDRRKLFIIVALLAAVAALKLGIVGARSQIFLTIKGRPFGMFTFSFHSLCVAHANDFVDSRSFIETASGLMLTRATGAVAGPLMGQSGGRGQCFSTIAVHVSMAAFAAFRTRKRTRGPWETRGAFVGAANAGSTVSAVVVGMKDDQARTPAAAAETTAEMDETKSQPS